MSYKHIKTLHGLTFDQIKEFSKNDTEHYFRVKLYDKDKSCKGCDKDIDRIDQASLDHILPRSYGGRTNEANLRLMHRKCNSKRSNNMVAISIDPRMFRKMKKNTPREVMA